VLRRGLLSPNYQIEIIAALGLADFGDKGSIPLIIEACSKAPAEAAAVIAEALVYFGSDSEPSARLWNEPGALIRLTAPCVALFRFRKETYVMFLSQGGHRLVARFWCRVGPRRRALMSTATPFVSSATS